VKTQAEPPNPHVQAFPGTISGAEGATHDALYGGRTFSGYFGHPPKIGDRSLASACQIAFGGRWRIPRRAGAWTAADRKTRVKSPAAKNQAD
jgi:hypothetical protein